jgi:hypothetical protein
MKIVIKKNIVRYELEIKITIRSKLTDPRMINTRYTNINWLIHYINLKIS